MTWASAPRGCAQEISNSTFKPLICSVETYRPLQEDYVEVKRPDGTVAKARMFTHSMFGEGFPHLERLVVSEPFMVPLREASVLATGVWGSS